MIVSVSLSLTRSSIVDTCPLSRFVDGDLSRLHSADDCAINCVATICRGEGIRELTDFQVLLQTSVFMALHIFKINLFPLAFVSEPIFMSLTYLLTDHFIFQCLDTVVLAM